MILPDSIYGRLRLTFIGLATVPLLVVGLALTWTTYTTQRNQVLDLQQELALRIGSGVAAKISSLESQLRITSAVTSLASRSQEDQEEILAQLQAENNNAFAELALLDQNGMEVVVNKYNEVVLPGEYENRSDDGEFQFFMDDPQGTVYYGPVDVSGASGASGPLMKIAIPLVDLRNGSLLFILVANVRFQEIWNILASEDLGEDENIYIVDQQDQVVGHNNPSIALSGENFPPPDEKGLHPGLDDTSVLMGIDRRSFPPEGDGEGEQGAGRQVFTIIAETPVRGVLRLALNAWIVILGLIFVAIAVANVLALAAARNITRPIQELAAVAEGIRGGDLAQRASTSGLRELDILANTFNKMTAELRQTLESLEQRVAGRTQALKTSAEVSRYLSTILDTDQLVAEVANLVQSAFEYYHVNIYLFDQNAENLVLMAASGEAGGPLLTDQFQQVPKDQGLIGKAAATNLPILAADVTQNPDWVPSLRLPDTRGELVIPIARGEQVLGVLDIQHDVVDKLNQEDVDLSQSIANQLAVALLNAQSFEQLVVDKLSEAKQKEEAENRLEAYRRSPAGQAEIFAEQVRTQPERSLADLHRLAQTAGLDPEAAAMLGLLPRFLDDSHPSGAEREQQEMQVLGKMAEGFDYLYSSQTIPELLLPGLRLLTEQLEGPLASGWPGSAEAFHVYRICQSAVEANTISQITELGWPNPSDDNGAPDFPLSALLQTLAEFQSTIDALNAYERVIPPEDRLSYLVAAVERLRHIERNARSELGAADISIVLRITENWQAIIAGALSDLQTQAKITCRLLTRHTLQTDVVSLVLSVRNGGRGAAVNLKVNLLEAPEYTLMTGTAEIEQLLPGIEEEVILRVRPNKEQNIVQFRARFIVSYDDPRGPNQSEHFADIVHLVAEPTQFQFIPNPYVAGAPLNAGSALFVGREDLLRAIQEDLTPAHRNNLVVIGQRRMGKTSLLKQLKSRLDPAYILVYLDGQVIGLDPGMANFFLYLATEITFSLEDQGTKVPQPAFDEFTQNPARYFEHQFLPGVMQAIGQRHLTILFDEFEELERAVQQGHLDSSIFGYLRHLMQHIPGLSFIFCGTHRLEELAADYWNVLFNLSLYHRVTSLASEDAMRLVQEPVESFGMRYDDLALEKIWRITAGHPYFLQLLCHSLVNWHNKTEHNYVTIADINTALDEILTSGEAHFIYLWTESTHEERMVLVAMSRMIPLTGSVQAVQVVDYLAERGAQVERKSIREALYHLTLREILSFDEIESGGERVFRWQLGLVGSWVERYKSLGRVLDEATT